MIDIACWVPKRFNSSGYRLPCSIYEGHPLSAMAKACRSVQDLRLMCSLGIHGSGRHTTIDIMSMMLRAGYHRGPSPPGTACLAL